MIIELNELHLARNVPVFLKAQSILESSENYTAEEMVTVEGELKLYTEQINEIRNKINSLAFDKWTKEQLDTS